ncbi:MAG: Spy/CpxP family protein refolding chaperone [Acidobacteriota bacterium]|nr:Spy/CpxP family protein refolding chaperone [Acidobacteriota bacterium]
MRKTTIAVAFAAVLTIGAIIVFAQISHKGGFGQHQDFMKHHEQIVEHLSEKLKLNDRQKTQVKQIIADSKIRIQPLLERFKESHRKTINLGNNGVFDEQKSQEAAEEQAEIVKQLLVEKEKTKAAIFAVLTPEQREQAKQMMNDLVESFGH